MDPLNLHKRIIYQINRGDSVVHMTVKYDSEKSPYCAFSLLASDQHKLWVSQQYIHGFILFCC